jgi:two-component system sensor histidine kinase YcbA
MGGDVIMGSFYQTVCEIVRSIQNLLHNNKSLVNTVLLVSLTSIVYVYPFGSYFRFTFAIILLTTFLLYFEQIAILPATIITGVAIVAFRTTTDVIMGVQDFEEAILGNLPSLTYYVAFGLLFYSLSIREQAENGLALVLLLSVTDIASNMVELFFRAELLNGNSKVILPSIVGVAVARAILAVIGYYALRQYQNFILANEQAERYIEQTVMVAQLKSELFYLEKSSQDIENVMEKAYWLYKQLNCQGQGIQTVEEPPEQALDIARGIHEIKKDYYRVISGIENILRPSSKAEEVKLSEILFIIKQNTQHNPNVIEKKISITYEQGEDFVTAQPYTLVSILNNLIINSIEACDDYGKIKVVHTNTKEEIVLCVEDNGIGIDEKEFELIFNPGYSTKFSPRTGKISTGLGLSHVKNYIELLGGTIRVESTANVCTKFFITLPSSSVMVV